MQNDIEFFADATLMMLMLYVGAVMVRADPLLPSVWALTTAVMTWRHHRP